MPNYQVNIKLDASTLAALNAGNFQMQVYKGAMSDSAGVPVVWFTLNQFAPVVTVNWDAEYGGYFSDTIAEPGATIVISASSTMNPGDILTLEADGSVGATTGGPSSDYTFASMQPVEWTCGLTTSANGSQPSAICAFPQFLPVDNLIQPYEKVLILFTQKPMNTGAVVQTAVTESISITLAPSEPSCSVNYDMNKGWDAGSSTQAVVNMPNFALAPALIVSPESTASTRQGNINLRKKTDKK